MDTGRSWAWVGLVHWLGPQALVNGGPSRGRACEWRPAPCLKFSDFVHESASLTRVFMCFFGSFRLKNKENRSSAHGPYRWDRAGPRCPGTYDHTHL